MKSQLHPIALAFACACSFMAEGTADTDTDSEGSDDTLPTLSPTDPSSSTSSASSASSAGSGDASTSSTSSADSETSSTSTTIDTDDSSSTGPDVDVPAGALLFFAFEDDEDGGAVEDLTGNGHDGMLVDGATFDGGRFGNGVRIDEEGGHVLVDDSADLELADGYTIEAWTRPLAGDQTLRDLVWRGDVGAMAYGVRLGIGATRPPIMATAPCVLNDVQPGLSPGDWHHVAVTWDGSTMRAYLDAELRVELACTDAMPGDDGPLYLGRASNGSGTWGLNGDLDHVAVFDHAREQPEICSDGGGTWSEGCSYSE